jgi:hypothetical protein
MKNLIMTILAGIIIGGCSMSSTPINFQQINKPDENHGIKQPKTDVTNNEDINKLIQQLGDDDWQKREKAQEELAKIGKPALEALKKASEDIDPEIAMSAKRIINEWTLQLVKNYLQNELVEQGLKGLIEDCWNLIEIKHVFLTKYIPDCKFFIADWIGEQTKPAPSKILGVTKYDDKVLVVQWGKVDIIISYLNAIKDKAESYDVASVLISLAIGADWKGKLMYEISDLSKQVKWSQTDNGYIITWKEPSHIAGRIRGEWIVEFNKDGVFKELKYKKY